MRWQGMGALIVAAMATAAHAQAPGALASLSAAVFEGGKPGFDMRRDWPSAVRFKAIEITPHAGLALGEAGPGAEAGATISLQDRLDGLGVRDGRSFGERGRWYVFAATSGRSVGLNMVRGGDGELRRAGWSTDATSALVSDAQAGIGWRRGSLQASVGYIHREIKPRHGIMGLETKDDDLVAISFSFNPR